MKKPFLIVILLVAFFILLCGCEEGIKSNAEKSILYTELSKSDISNNVDQEVKKSIRKLIATSKCLTCTFTSAILSGKDLKGKILTSSNLASSNLASSNLEEADLIETNLNLFIECRMNTVLILL